MTNKVACFLILFSLAIFSGTSQTYQVHSHNDYEQDIPYWKALSAGASSIEADVFLSGGTLLVGHEEDKLQPGRTLERLYLKPISETLQMGFLQGRKLQLLIDVKSEARTTLDAIVKLLEGYPMITGNAKISVVISGNRPAPPSYIHYPEFISFDFQSLEPITDPEVLNKIALISLNFKNFTDWNGRENFSTKDLERVAEAVEKAHAWGKPIRFWATPDLQTAWKALADLGVDYINTDHPFECVRFVDSLPK